MQDLTLGPFSKVAILTDAARWIGRSTVELLTAHGVRIVAEDISPAVNDLAQVGKVLLMVGRLRRGFNRSRRRAARDRELRRLTCWSIMRENSEQAVAGDQRCGLGRHYADQCARATSSTPARPCGRRLEPAAARL